MAKLCIRDYVSIGMVRPPTAVSWQVSLDKDFKDIIDESIKDNVNITSWTTPLKKIGSNNEYYKNLDNLYSRISLWYDDLDTPWYTVDKANQNMQELIFVKDNEIVKTVSPEESINYN